MKLITVTEYLMGRAKYEDLDDQLRVNVDKLIPVINALLADYGQYRKVNSGYRRPVDNAAAGGSKRSNHMVCAAIDLEDKDGNLDLFCTEEILDKYDLYKEHPDATPGWCHLQIVSPRSGNRIFRP